MGVRGEAMRSAPTEQGRRRNGWEDSGCAVGPQQDRRTKDSLPGDVPQRATRGQQSSEPEPSHVAVTSQLPTGQIPWGLLGRWPPYPILFMLSLPQLPECISCCLPGGPLPWPHLSWQPLPLLPDTWQLCDNSEAAAFVFLPPSGKGTSFASHQVIQACV